LRKEGAGEAEGLGRLNLVAASAALADRVQVVSTREAIAKERSLWLSVLRELNLPHTDSRANFVFFDAGWPQSRPFNATGGPLERTGQTTLASRERASHSSSWRWAAVGQDNFRFHVGAIH
jgi:histidinol-phosphate/aromatic aminotransferase/cobyric acid decarboxylase-like protein